MRGKDSRRALDIGLVGQELDQGAAGRSTTSFDNGSSRKEIRVGVEVECTSSA